MAFACAIAVLVVSDLSGAVIPIGDFRYDTFRLGASIGNETAHIAAGSNDTLWIRSEMEYHAPGDTSGTPNADYVKSKPALGLHRTTGQPLRYYYLALNRGVIEEANVVVAGTQIAQEGQSVPLGGTSQVEPHSVVDDFDPASGIILDNLMVGALYGVIARYDFTTGGRQILMAFVPSIGQTIPIVVVNRGDVALRASNGLFATRLLFVRFGVHAVNVWIDDNFRIARVTWPYMGVESRLRDFSGRPWQEPADLQSIRTDAVRFTSGGATLEGVVEYTEARGLRPAVLLAPGFGARTRNGSIQGSPLQQDAYAPIASHLARAGFVVMRYDARGAGRTGGSSDTLLLADRVPEVRAALAALAKQKGVDKKRIGVIAFDLAAHIVAMAAGEKAPVAGMVAVGPIGVPIDSVFEERVRMTPFGPDEARAAREAIVRLRERLEGTEQWSEVSGQKIFLPAMRELLTHKAEDVVGRLACPILLVGGGMDWEVPGTGAVRLHEALRSRGKENVEIYTADAIDHNLMRLDAGSQLADLADAGREVDPLTLSVLVAWLSENVGRKRP